MRNYSLLVAVNCGGTLSVHYVKLQIPRQGTNTLYDLPLQGALLRDMSSAQLAEYWRQVGEFLQDKRLGVLDSADFFVVQSYHRPDFNFARLDEMLRSGDQEIVQ